ncbi:hypothetical protein BDF22DRAFT_658334 [Syncephalis plumigaleata]|nr:hypothetical protein BDF22DRAFT_658334 [Syncephalis plumigaleata]
MGCSNPQSISNTYQVFSFNKVIQELNRFTNSQLSAFYFQSIKERVYAGDKLSLARRSAQTAVYRPRRFSFSPHRVGQHHLIAYSSWYGYLCQYYQLVGRRDRSKLEDSAMFPLGQLLQKYVKRYHYQQHLIDGVLAGLLNNDPIHSIVMNT